MGEFGNTLKVQPAGFADKLKIVQTMCERETDRGKITYDLMVTMKPRFHRQEEESNTYCIGSSQGISIAVGIEHLAHFIYHCHHYLLWDVFETTHLNPSSLF